MVYLDDIDLDIYNINNSTRVIYPKCSIADLTVLIRYHNDPIEDLKRAIYSVLNQKDLNFEILIVDNGSNTPLSLKDLPQDPRIGLCIQEFSDGPLGARLCGINHARTKYIRLLDGDDEFVEDSIAPMLQYVIDNDYYFCPSNCLEMGTSREIKHAIDYDNVTNIKDEIMNAKQMCFAGPSVIFKKDIAISQKPQWAFTNEDYFWAKSILENIPEEKVGYWGHPTYYYNLTPPVSASKGTKNYKHHFLNYVNTYENDVYFEYSMSHKKFRSGLQSKYKVAIIKFDDENLNMLIPRQNTMFLNDTFLFDFIGKKDFNPNDYDIVISTDLSIKADYYLTLNPTNNVNNIYLFGKSALGKNLTTAIDFTPTYRSVKNENIIRGKLGINKNFIISLVYDGTMDIEQFHKIVDKTKRVVTTINNDIVFHIHSLKQYSDIIDASFNDDYIKTTSEYLNQTSLILPISSIFISLTTSYYQSLSILIAQSGGSFIMSTENRDFNSLFLENISGHWISSDPMCLSESILNNFSNSGRRNFSSAFCRSRFSSDLLFLDLENFLMYDLLKISKPLVYNNRIFKYKSFSNSIRLSYSKP